MYINPTTTYYRGGEQCTRRGDYLLLVQSDARPLGPENFRALMRRVALRQCGQWMMGCARVFGRVLTVSGAYGADGLPMTVQDDVYERAVPVPGALYAAWNKGGGWNNAGQEADAMRTWARATFNV